METSAGPAQLAVCSEKSERLKFRTDFEFVYRFDNRVPSMDWWANRLIPDVRLGGWEFLRAGDVGYVRQQGASAYRLRHPDCTDDSAVGMSADAAGLVLCICAVAWEVNAPRPDPRLRPLLDALVALARTHAEAHQVGMLVFPLERLAWH